MRWDGQAGHGRYKGRSQFKRGVRKTVRFMEIMRWKQIVWNFIHLNFAESALHSVHWIYLLRSSCLSEVSQKNCFFSILSCFCCMWFLRQAHVLLGELLTANENNNAVDRCEQQELCSSVTGYTLYINKLILLSKEPRKK